MTTAVPLFERMATVVSPWLIAIGLAALFFVFGYVFCLLLLLSEITAKLAGTSQRNIGIFSDVLEFGDVIVSLSQVYVLIGVVVFAAWKATGFAH